MLACFNEKAIVRDDGETLQGKDTIKAWIDKVTQEYQMTHVVTGKVLRTPPIESSKTSNGDRLHQLWAAMAL